ncbi:serine protease [Datura stramonium]|uniref:Serine protease n=1 Tax=Datura stramonium TaxID=4076 RepID=A0ABS8TI53_DATST|nr:serine protease [Datura stramonium]
MNEHASQKLDSFSIKECQRQLKLGRRRRFSPHFSLPVSFRERNILLMSPENFSVIRELTAEDWRKALSKVVPAVVVLRTTACRAFDTESAGCQFRNGFLLLISVAELYSRTDMLLNPYFTDTVMAKWALRNYGPVMAEAMFVNREEIPVYPIYRDPMMVWIYCIGCRFGRSCVSSVGIVSSGGSQGGLRGRSVNMEIGIVLPIACWFSSSSMIHYRLYQEDDH